MMEEIKNSKIKNSKICPVFGGFKIKSDWEGFGIEEQE